MKLSVTQGGHKMPTNSRVMNTKVLDARRFDSAYLCNVPRGTYLLILNNNTMRAISKKSAQAFMDAENLKLSNTKVVVETMPNGEKIVYMYLFNNLIAARFADNPRQMVITPCGWKTATTKDRLNALPNVYIRQSKGEWYLNGKKWDGIASSIGM